MPFGLSNAPITFQALINSLLEPYLWKLVILFFNDILIYNSFIELHVEHLILVLKTLRSNQLFAKLSKCIFYEEIVEFVVWYCDSFCGCGLKKIVL
jgi:hypothetical protein